MEDKNINVLYIDDEPNNITSFKAALGGLLYRRIAEEGRIILKEQHVILSDQRMPKMTALNFSIYS